MNQIANLRSKLGLSQAKLGKSLNVSTSTVAMWELEKRSPPLKKAKEIADFFDLSIEEIFLKANMT